MTDRQRESGMDGSPEPILPEHFASRRELREARGLTPHRHPLIRRIVAVVAVLAAVAVAGGVYAYWRLNANITQIDVTSALGTNRPSVAAAASGSTGPLNILLIGSDTRAGDGNGGFGDRSWGPGAHSDWRVGAWRSRGCESAGGWCAGAWQLSRGSWRSRALAIRRSAAKPPGGS